MFTGIILFYISSPAYLIFLPKTVHTIISISLKKARALTGSKDIDLLKMDELRKHTGYIRGGCSPLGMIKKYPTYIEETALLEDSIFVSAGERGYQLLLKPEDLRKACDGTFADFV